MTNQDLHDKLLELLENGYTVLAETERFVHQIQRQFRLRRIEEGKSGWESPKIFTLNRWMENFWAELWPEEMPASSFFLRWRYLKECLDEVPPPDPVNADIELIELLNESFEQCLRYAMDPGEGQEVGRLMEWRRQVWRSFDRRLADGGFFHPARLPEKISQSLSRLEGSANLGQMAFVGFEFAGYWEKHLLEVLQKNAGAIFFALPSGEARPQRLVYADPEQEITGLMEALPACAAEYAPHEIAIVCDFEFYSPAISNGLRDILGEPLCGELAAYNLCPDRNLAGYGLYNAAVLPIRCALGGERRDDLFAFLRSPYYGTLSRWNRRLSHCDRIWREKGIESGIDFLLDAVHDSVEEIFPDGCERISSVLAPFRNPGAQIVSNWTGALRLVWAAFEFPVLANELDQIAWDNLVRIISEFEAVLGQTRLNANEFFELLNAAAGRVRIQKRGFEDAGIQVLSRLDVRGLTFRKIFLPGFVSGSFPQPARTLPLLSSSERRSVLGGTIESQFAFARYLYANFMAAAPDIVLSRPAISKDGEILIQSPFWEKDDEKQIDPVIAWRHRLPAMQRARWVRQSICGHEHCGRYPIPDTCIDQCGYQTQPLPILNSITVSELQSALLCRARYFFRHVLGLDALCEFEPGIPPLERGKNIHAILASFVLRAMEDLKDSDAGLEGLADLLKKTATDIIKPRLCNAVWQVELERLTGRPGYSGLLLKWLYDGWERMLDGWRWVTVERQFEGLEIDGCKVVLRGRVDRIDSHPEQGLMCWDYKTGRLPSRTQVIEENTQPQLPAYLLALSRGKITGTPKADECGAGFIELTSPGKMKHQVVFDPAVDHGSFLKNWEEAVSAALNSIFAGDLSPLWLKDERVCEERCEFRGICGEFLIT